VNCFWRLSQAIHPASDDGKHQLQTAGEEAHSGTYITLGAAECNATAVKV